MSCTLSVSSNTCQGPGRSRSCSVTESISPDSTSSDSHSSSDPDTHLSTLSPWLQTPTPTGSKATFFMDIDAASNAHAMDLDSEMSFDGAIHDLQALHSFQSGNFGFEDIRLSHASTGTKSDMLMLEEIIKDGAFDPATSTVPPFSSYSTCLPALRDYFVPSPPMSQESPSLCHGESQCQPPTDCIDPSSTQARAQPALTVGKISTSPNSSSTSESASTSAPTIPPNAQESVDDKSPKHELFADPHPPPLNYSPHSISVSSKVVYPPKDVCFDLPILFPSIPLAGTKSRVETQIKLAFELCIPISRSSTLSSANLSSLERSSVNSSPRPSSSSSSETNSQGVSPALGSWDLPPTAEDKLQRVTHDKVGTYRFLRLPDGTTTKRRSVNSANAKGEPKACDVDPQEILQMTADVVCCSPPHALVQSCASCQAREAKRTARKVAARVRPPPGARPKPKSKVTGKKSTKKAKDSAAESADFEEEVDIEEPNVDGRILQFNCSEIVKISSGTTVLPMRITCYCRHHKEKIGFNIVFTLRDHIGRVVGRGTTPPILITDDHKSTNAVSKLPPMHPLRHKLTPSTPPPIASSASSYLEDAQHLSVPDQAARAPTRRRDVDAEVKKRRPKPYDGRPANRTIGVVPGIGGRQGVVLALHPAHTRLLASTQAPMVTGVASPTPSTDTGASPSSRSSSSPATRSPTPSYHDVLLPSTSSTTGSFVNQGDASRSTPVARAVVSQSPSPKPVYQPTVTSPSSTLSSSSISQDFCEAQHHPLADLQLYTQEHPPIFDASSYPIYPTLPFPSDPLPPPKIHRLIPSSGPTTGGIEITVLGSNFHASLPLECVFGGAVASSTHRWSDNTLVCVLPPRATPGMVSVDFKSAKQEEGQDEGVSCLFTYVDESDRQLMELALQVVGLKMTGKIEEARNVAMRIVGNTGAQSPTMTAGELTQMNTLSETSLVHHSFLGSLSGVDLETLVIKLLTLLDVPMEDDSRLPTSLRAIEYKNATGQTLLHLAVLLALPSLVSCLIGRSIDIDARNHNGLTALHFAALTGWKEGVQLLLAEGANTGVVDAMGLTPAQRAKNGRFKEIEALLQIRVLETFSETESGDDGDDEARNSCSDESDVDRSPLWHTTRRYLTRSRMGSPTHPDSLLDEHSEPESSQEKPVPQLQVAQMGGPPATQGKPITEKPILDEKHDASFVERLQRTLPQGIIPNVQIPGFPQLQLPDMLAAPWGALPQIPVFPVFVPIPNLPHLPNWPGFPWPDCSSGEKKETRPDDAAREKQQQQPPFAMLWTAYDSLTNSAWRAQWEKWVAQVMALQNANNRGAELPPYSPRSEEKPTEQKLTPALVPEEGPEPLPSIRRVLTTEDVPAASTSRLPPLRASRRVVYDAVKVSETEVHSYHYPSKKQNKKDRMLILFWIPILILGLAYAIYTTLPVAFAGISRAAKRMLPQPLQKGQV